MLDGRRFIVHRDRQALTVVVKHLNELNTLQQHNLLVLVHKCIRQQRLQKKQVDVF